MSSVGADFADKARLRALREHFAAPISVTRAAEGIRSHWAIENSLHWVLDVTFGDDQSRLRTGHGATNLAIVRYVALNLMRTVKNKQSKKLWRERAGLDSGFLATIFGAT